MDGRSQWTEEQAQQYQQASAKLHSLSHEATHLSTESGDDLPLSKQLQDAQEEFDRLQAQLQSAQHNPSRVASVLRFLGIVLVLAGAFGSYRQRFHPRG